MVQCVGGTTQTIVVFCGFQFSDHDYSIIFRLTKPTLKAGIGPIYQNLSLLRCHVKWHRDCSKAMTSNAQHGPEKFGQTLLHPGRHSSKALLLIFSKGVGGNCLGTNFIPLNWKHVQYSVRQTIIGKTQQVLRGC